MQRQNVYEHLQIYIDVCNEKYEISFRQLLDLKNIFGFDSAMVSLLFHHKNEWACEKKVTVFTINCILI